MSGPTRPARGASAALRVLHVYARFHPDYTGDGIYFRRVIASLDGDGSEHEVLAAQTAEPPPADRLPRLPVRYLGLRRGGPDRLRLIAALVRHARRFDVVHLHSHVDRTFVAYALLRLLGVRVVFSCSLTDGPGELLDTYRRSFRPLVAWLLRRAVDAWVVISPQLKRSALRAVDEERVAILPQGVELGDDQAPSREAAREQLGVRPGSRVLLNVGSISRRKNTAFLVQALGPLLGPDVELWIVGPEIEPDYAAEVRGIVRSLGREDRVRFFGFVDQPARIFAAADVFVFASLNEGFPNVYLEAMRAGLPVVTMSLPAMTDHLFDHGRTGLLCGDPAGFRVAVEDLVESPARAQAIGAQARAAVRAFSLDRVAERYGRLYRALRAHGRFEADEVELGGFRPRPCSVMHRGPQALGFAPVDWPADLPPVLTVVIDARSETHRPAGVASHGADEAALDGLRRVVDMLEALGVPACCTVDYAMAGSPRGAAVIRELAAAGVEIGAHLRPWITPPVVEPRDDWHSFCGNLGPALERQKLERLARAIASVVGAAPRVFKAGRHGASPQTYAAIAAAGFEVDLSIAPGLDLSPVDGPSYRSFDAKARWYGADPGLLVLPATAGPARPPGPGRVVGGRSRDARIVHLAPDAHPLPALLDLTRRLSADGCRNFTMTVASAALPPSGTAGMPAAGDPDAVLDRLDAYIRAFRSEIGGVCLAPTELRERLRSMRSAARPAPAKAPTRTVQTGLAR